ncbi:hypothetical protein HYALB_00002201 [Hymenoscyphus albidus]|uniref:Uncharacterized protein n=1 Tax=Hymenoscyphus albidus TaxID=595503 RepID=A0A9N9PZ92_9HELO|nr:hypothetical protein HYALB_00002201 [Hymenoscyphus albidus]
MSKVLLLPHTIEMNYKPPATYNSVLYPLNNYGSTYGISTEIDRAIIGLAPEIILECCHEIQSRLDKRRSHASHMSPLQETSRLFKRAFSSYRDGRIDSRILDLKSFPGRLLHNITSTPLHCALLIAEIHHVNTERKSVKHRLFEDLLDSLGKATHSVFSMLVKLYLKTQDSLKSYISSPHGFGVFLALGMLFEAYGSRLAPANTLYLVSGHVLEREHCSGIALAYFNKVCKLRESILSVLEPLPEVVGAEIQIWENLLERILTTLISFPYIALACPQSEDFTSTPQCMIPTPKQSGSLKSAHPSTTLPSISKSSRLINSSSPPFPSCKKLSSERSLRQSKHFHFSPPSDSEAQAPSSHADPPPHLTHRPRLPDSQTPPTQTPRLPDSQTPPTTKLSLYLCSPS